MIYAARLAPEPPALPGWLAALSPTGRGTRDVAMTCGIYCITHIASGRKYVGLSRNIERRWAVHKLGYGYHLGAAIKKYGAGEFRFEVLEECSEDYLCEREIHWISFLNTVHPYGFNLTGGGQSGGMSEETAKKHRRAVQKATRSPDHRKKMSKILSARFKQEDYRQSTSRAAYKRWSDPGFRERQTAKIRSFPEDPIWVSNHQQAMKKLFDDPNHRRKIVEANKRKASDPVYRKNHAAAMKKRRGERDLTQYRVHKNGVVKEGTRRELSEFLGVTTTAVRYLIEGKTKRCQGWELENGT